VRDATKLKMDGLCTCRVKNDQDVYLVPFRLFSTFWFFLIFTELWKLSDSINFIVILHYFVVVYFHKCRKISFSSALFLHYNFIFDHFHPNVHVPLQFSLVPPLLCMWFSCGWMVHSVLISHTHVAPIRYAFAWVWLTSTPSFKGRRATRN
jgi:hypothetical protein